MKKFRIAEISVTFGMIIAVLFSVIGFEKECCNIRNDVVRLHILANSDSDEDQRVKLSVRDALLNSSKELFNGTINKDNAEQALKINKDELIRTANKVLKENGFNYTTQIYLTEEYFTTRTYENFTLPAGEYMALKVVLGNGEGHNWWCVMFPPLCLPAASKNADIDAVFGESGAEIIQNAAKYEMRFKIIEIIESIKCKLSNRINYCK